MLTSNEVGSNRQEYVLKFMLALAGNSSVDPRSTKEYADNILEKATMLYYIFKKEVEAAEESR
jgi:hypothetical protein